MQRGKRGAGRLTRRSNGRWQAQWSRTEGGRRIRESRTFDLKHDAEWWLASAKRGHLPDADLDVGEYLDRWLRGKRDIRESTRGLYRSHIDVHLKPELGRFDLLRLQQRHVEGFMDRLSVGPSTAGSILRTLRMALADGVRKRDLPENPAAFVKAPRVDRDPVEALTADDTRQIVAAVRGTWLEHPVRFLLGSGCRISEACGLDQSDVHEGFVVLRRPKTKPRATMVSEDAAAALSEAIRQAPRRGPHEPVFFGPRTGDRLSKGILSHGLPRHLERAGLTKRSPHALRHAVATMMVAAGVPMRVVADQLGHADPSLTARVYAHVLPESRRDAVAVLDRAVRKETG